MAKKKSKKTKKEVKKEITKNPLLYIGILIMVVVIGYLIYNTSTDLTDTSKKDTKESFEQCLTKAGLKMYGTEWCSFCMQQKRLFGDAFENVAYIDCDQNKELCTSEEIRGYPTWKMNGESYQGVQSLEKLAQLSDCEL